MTRTRVAGGAGPERSTPTGGTMASFVHLFLSEIKNGTCADRHACR
jgi:hypothetical protein